MLPLHHAWAPYAAQKWLPASAEGIPSLPGTSNPVSSAHYGAKQWKVKVGHPPDNSQTLSQGSQE